MFHGTIPSPLLACQIPSCGGPKKYPGRENKEDDLNSTTGLFAFGADPATMHSAMAALIGPGVATGVSAALFGLWHVLPALDVTRTNTAIRGRGRLAERRRVLVTVLGTVVFTALAGVVFAELRRRSGSVVAPLGLHWATNGLAVVAAARVWALSPPPSSPAPPSG